MSFPKLVVCKKSVAGCGRGVRLKKRTKRVQNYAKVGVLGNVNEYFTHLYMPYMYKLGIIGKGIDCTITKTHQYIKLAIDDVIRGQKVKVKGFKSKSTPCTL